MIEGLYKCEYSINDAVGRSVMFVRGGRMLGGNLAFGHFGSYRQDGEEIDCTIETLRHNDDPSYKPLLGADVATLHARGRLYDDRTYRFEGNSPQMPGALFRSKMTLIDDGLVPQLGAVGEGGVANGLYSLRLRTLDGVDGGLTGVMLLLDGRILGGDAYFYYLGTYTSAHGRWKGEMVNQEHTPARDKVPVFGGHEVGIGFSGTCDATGAELEAAAFTGRRSIRLTAVLRLMQRA